MMLPSRALLGMALLAVALAGGRPAHAWEVGERAEVWGYLQAWATLYEQMEDAAGLFQYPPDGDEAVTSTTGFSLARVRIGGRVELVPKRLELAAQLRFEKPVGLLDCYLRYRAADWLQVQLGQFKTPGTYEALVSSAELDFILRSNIARYLADYSLSRTVHASSHFAGNRAYLRDMGLAVRGDIAIPRAVVRYFAMVGNGLGNNLFISGDTRREFIITNDLQFLYAGRLEVADLFDMVSVGGHVTWNKHDNMVLNSGRKVFDLDRLTYSADAHVRVPWVHVRLGGLYAAGEIREDYDRDEQGDLDYEGFELHALWNLSAFLDQFVKGAFLSRHRFQVGARFDRYDETVNKAPVSTRQENWTASLEYALDPWLRVQLNYVRRNTHYPADPDLADDTLFAMVQGRF